MGIHARRGFTLLEILLVIAAIGILAGIVIFAINPNKQLGDTRNAQRRVDVNTILNAIYQYSIDNYGLGMGQIDTTEREICIKEADPNVCLSVNGIMLQELTDNGKYLVSIPHDPLVNSPVISGYRVIATAEGRITVKAPEAEGGVTISVTR